MARIFEGFDLTEFWEDSDYAREQYVGEPPTEELISQVEAELGVRLPASYVELARSQNGGIPRNKCFPTNTRTSWSKDHIAISGVLSIGSQKTYSLCGELGSKFMQTEWGYPDIGVCICDCPSAGHDMIMLDYRKCGQQGEPEVIHVDQELDYKITFLAKDFEHFIRGLVNESVYDERLENLMNDLKKIESGSFSSLLTNLISQDGNAGIDMLLRNTCRRLAIEKECFALHADNLSYLVYDILFYLYTKSNRVEEVDSYLKIYPRMLALCDGEFSTGGYAPGFVRNWITSRILDGNIVTTSSGSLTFSEDFLQKLNKVIRPPE